MTISGNFTEAQVLELKRQCPQLTIRSVQGGIQVSGGGLGDYGKLGAAIARLTSPQ